MVGFTNVALIMGAVAPVRVGVSPTHSAHIKTARAQLNVNSAEIRYRLDGGIVEAKNGPRPYTLEQAPNPRSQVDAGRWPYKGLFVIAALVASVVLMTLITVRAPNNGETASVSPSIVTTATPTTSRTDMTATTSLGMSPPHHHACQPRPQHHHRRRKRRSERHSSPSPLRNLFSHQRRLTAFRTPTPCRSTPLVYLPALKLMRLAIAADSEELLGFLTINGRRPPSTSISVSMAAHLFFQRCSAPARARNSIWTLLVCCELGSWWCQIPTAVPWATSLL